LKKLHPDTGTAYSCILDDVVQELDAEVDAEPDEDNAQ